MITDIISVFRTQARQHKTIKAFYYNRNYELGTGCENHPLLWLEDPIYGRNHENVFVNSVNFSVLFLPEADKTVSELQNLAYSIGLNIIERIKAHENDIRVRPDWTYTTLRNYYDNNACGCRFSVNFTQANMQDLCLIDEQFDPVGEFGTSLYLDDFEVKPSANGEIYAGKFPEFNLKTSKK